MKLYLLECVDVSVADDVPLKGMVILPNDQDPSYWIQQHSDFTWKVLQSYALSGISDPAEGFNAMIFPGDPL